MLLKWYAPCCQTWNISIDKRHHQMDFCECGESGVDYETYGLRLIGPVINTNFTENKPVEIDYDFWTELVLNLDKQGFEPFIGLGDGRTYLPIELVYFIRGIEDEIIKEMLK